MNRFGQEMCKIFRADLLVKQRLMRGLNRNGMAKLLGISYSYYAKIETKLRKPTQILAIKSALKLGLPYDFFITPKKKIKYATW